MGNIIRSHYITCHQHLHIGELKLIFLPLNLIYFTLQKHTAIFIFAIRVQTLRELINKLCFFLSHCY